MDVVLEMVNVVVFVLVLVIGFVVFLIGVDVFGVVVLLIWLVFYVLLIWFFLLCIWFCLVERVLVWVMVMGQVVDIIINIKMVKFFVNVVYEDCIVLGVMVGFCECVLDFGCVSIWFCLLLMIIVGVLLVIFVGGMMYLWYQGLVMVGDIVVLGVIVMWLVQMIGWVSMVLMGVWGFIGEVEDGMQILLLLYSLIDVFDVLVLGWVWGQIDFDYVSFVYGWESGGICDMDLYIVVGEKLGIVGVLGVGKFIMVLLLLWFYDVEWGMVWVDGYDVW